MKGGAPVAQREASSPAVLIQRTQAVVRAWAAHDEPAVRYECRLLASEARTLAGSDPLWLDGCHQRQRIMVEAEPSGRGGSS